MGDRLHATYFSGFDSLKVLHYQQRGQQLRQIVRCLTHRNRYSGRNENYRRHGREGKRFLGHYCTVAVQTSLPNFGFWEQLKRKPAATATHNSKDKLML